MPISIEIEPVEGIAIATCSGVLRLEDAQRAATALWETPGWEGRAAVWDFRTSEFDLSSSETLEIARFVLEHQPTPPPTRMAFVTARDADFGMARMFQTFREAPPTAFRVFRDYDEALVWARGAESDPDRAGGPVKAT